MSVRGRQRHGRYNFSEALYPHPYSLSGVGSYSDPWSGGLSGMVGGDQLPPWERTHPSTRNCAHCGNLYPWDIIQECKNCPTCAGSWED